MSRITIYKCNICDIEHRGFVDPCLMVGIQFLGSKGSAFRLSDKLDECGSHVCTKCAEYFVAQYKKEAKP